MALFGGATMGRWLGSRDLGGTNEYSAPTRVTFQLLLCTSR